MLSSFLSNYACISCFSLSLSTTSTKGLVFPSTDYKTSVSSLLLYYSRLRRDSIMLMFSVLSDS